MTSPLITVEGLGLSLFKSHLLLQTKPNILEFIDENLRPVEIQPIELPQCKNITMFGAKESSIYVLTLDRCLYLYSYPDLSMNTHLKDIYAYATFKESECIFHSPEKAEISLEKTKYNLCLPEAVYQVRMNEGFSYFLAFSGSLYVHENGSANNSVTRLDLEHPIIYLRQAKANVVALTGRSVIYHFKPESKTPFIVHVSPEIYKNPVFYVDLHLFRKKTILNEIPQPKYDQEYAEAIKKGRYMTSALAYRGNLYLSVHNTPNEPYLDFSLTQKLPSSIVLDDNTTLKILGSTSKHVFTSSRVFPRNLFFDIVSNALSKLPFPRPVVSVSDIIHILDNLDPKLNLSDGDFVYDCKGNLLKVLGQGDGFIWVEDLSLSRALALYRLDSRDISFLFSYNKKNDPTFSFISISGEKRPLLKKPGVPVIKDTYISDLRYSPKLGILSVIGSSNGEAVAYNFDSRELSLLESPHLRWICSTHDINRQIPVLINGELVQCCIGADPRFLYKPGDLVLVDKTRIAVVVGNAKGIVIRDIRADPSIPDLAEYCVASRLHLLRRIAAPFFIEFEFNSKPVKLNLSTEIENTQHLPGDVVTIDDSPQEHIFIGKDDEQSYLFDLKTQQLKSVKDPIEIILKYRVDIPGTLRTFPTVNVMVSSIYRRPFFPGDILENNTGKRFHYLGTSYAADSLIIQDESGQIYSIPTHFEDSLRKVT